MPVDSQAEADSYAQSSSTDTQPCPTLNAQPCPTEEALKTELEKVREEVEFWSGRANMPNPQLVELESKLQTCLAANTTMELDWALDRQQLEELKAQHDYYLKLSGVRADRVRELEEELEQMERTQEQMDLRIQALGIELGEVEAERNQYKQKWEQSLAPTTTGRPTTATKPGTAPILPPPLASEPSLRERVLSVLENLRTEVTSVDILEALGMPNEKKTRGKITDTLGGLVKDGLVVRRPHPEDKRGTLYRWVSTEEIQAVVEQLDLTQLLQ